jgi:hypothetical protein
MRIILFENVDTNKTILQLIELNKTSLFKCKEMVNSFNIKIMEEMMRLQNNIDMMEKLLC